MKVHHDEGVATHIDPEPCAGIREDDGEASVGERTGQPLSRENWINPGADAVDNAEGNTGGCVTASARATRRGRRPLYEAFEVKRYFTAFFTFFIPVSLFDSESRFFAPTRTFRRPARAGAVKADRRSALTSRSIVSRPSLDRPEHGGTLVVSG